MDKNNERERRLSLSHPIVLFLPSFSIPFCIALRVFFTTFLHFFPFWGLGVKSGGGVGAGGRVLIKQTHEKVWVSFFSFLPPRLALKLAERQTPQLPRRFFFLGFRCVRLPTRPQP
jgi:hypothetical protein